MVITMGMTVANTMAAQAKSLNKRIWEKHSLGKTWIYLLSSTNYKKHFLTKRDLINIIWLIKYVCISSIFSKFLSASS